MNMQRLRMPRRISRTFILAGQYLRRGGRETVFIGSLLKFWMVSCRGETKFTLYFVAKRAYNPFR